MTAARGISRIEWEGEACNQPAGTAKDIETFDHQLFDFIKNDADLSFNENTISELRTISDDQLEKKNISVDELSLTPEQKTIVGVNGDKTAYIRDLLELRRRIYQTQHHILAKETLPSEKAQLSQNLARDVQHDLQRNPKQSVYALIGYTASGRRGLFTKTYLDSKLIQTNSQTHSLSNSLA